MSQFSQLTPRPADALLGLMAAFRADPREDKIDLGVGVYRNEAGETPIMAAVREAERRLAETAPTKSYESPQGNLGFGAQITNLVYGDDKNPPQTVPFAAPGGTGALCLSMGLAQRLNAEATVWVSSPSWPNHPHVAKTAGLKADTYSYAAPGAAKPDLDNVLDDLSRAAPRDVVILQGPCHNPTGIDLDTDQWKQLAGFVKEKSLLPVIDIAYHGFGTSLDEDLVGVRAFLQEVDEALISYSCSKNFGLYRDRVGCLILQGNDADALDAARTHVADIARAIYSMPPAHGPAVVETIMTTPDLQKLWEDELSQMQRRMTSLRRTLAEALHPSSNSFDASVLKTQNGMFSLLPLVTDGAAKLKEGGLYLPGSGRVNIAGLTESTIPRAAEQLSKYL